MANRKVTERKVTPLSEVIKQLIDDGKQFFVNSLLQPVVFVPDDAFRREWEVTHERFLAHVSAIYHSIGGDYLKHAERDMLIDLLKEECYKGGRRLTEVEAALIEKESIVEAVLLFLTNRKEDFDGLTRDLLAALREDFIQDRIVPPDPNFPVLCNIFSRRLNQLVPALRDLGVGCEIGHDDDGSHTMLRKLAHFQPVADALKTKASGQSSVATTDPPKGTAAPDGSDDTDGSCEQEHPYLLRVSNIRPA
jgi:hypothetical protein